MTWLRENLTADGTVTTTDTWLLRRLGAGNAAGGRLLARSRPVRLIPERPAHLDAGWPDQAEPLRGPRSGLDNLFQGEVR
jgi:hypothetical protein